VWRIHDGVVSAADVPEIGFKTTIMTTGVVTGFIKYIGVNVFERSRTWIVSGGLSSRRLKAWIIEWIFRYFRILFTRNKYHEATINESKRINEFVFHRVMIT
jgi:hypothetical protein